MPPPGSHRLKILAMPLSAVYQHFPNERSKFRSKVVVKDFQDCDSIIPLHFCLLFKNCYLKKTLAKSLIKSFQRVGKKATVYAIGYQRTIVVFYKPNYSEFFWKRKRWKRKR